jgi:hypothetical protein
VISSPFSYSEGIRGRVGTNGRNGVATIGKARRGLEEGLGRRAATLEKVGKRIKP